MAGILFNSSGRVFRSGGLALTGCAYKQAIKCSDSSATTLYLQESKIPASGFIKRTSDGLCYSFGSTCYACLPGSSTDLAGDFTSVTGCDDAGCGGATCSFGGGCCYEISGYADGMFTACTGCLNDSSSTIWDGKFINTTGFIAGFGAQWWIATYCGRTGSDQTRISGKLGDIAYSQGGSPLTCISYQLGTDTCWAVRIYCCFQPPGQVLTDYILIWSGEKLTGGDPSGVYTRTGGCDATSAISIVAC